MGVRHHYFVAREYFSRLGSEKMKEGMYFANENKRPKYV